MKILSHYLIVPSIRELPDLEKTLSSINVNEGQENIIFSDEYRTSCANRLNPMTSYVIYKAYVLPRLLYGFEVLVLTKGQLDQSSKYHIQVIQTLLSPLLKAPREGIETISSTRQLIDTVFGDNSSTQLKTTHRHFLKTIHRHFCLKVIGNHR